jgi:hypothetical protein
MVCTSFDRPQNGKKTGQRVKGVWSMWRRMKWLLTISDTRNPGQARHDLMTGPWFTAFRICSLIDKDSTLEPPPVPVLLYLDRRTGLHRVYVILTPKFINHDTTSKSANRGTSPQFLAKCHLPRITSMLESSLCSPRVHEPIFDSSI